MENPDGMLSEHEPLPVCGGVGGLSPFSVAPLSSQLCSAMNASELMSRIGPPECWTSSGRDGLIFGSMFGTLVS